MTNKQEQGAITEVLSTGHALIDRWELPAWKEAEATAVFINKHRQALTRLQAMKDAVPDDLSDAVNYKNMCQSHADGILYEAAQLLEKEIK